MKNYTKCLVLSLFGFVLNTSLAQTISPQTAPSAESQQTSSIEKRSEAPKVLLKNLPFSKRKEALLAYSTRRIEDLTKEKVCIENSQTDKELYNCVAMIKSNHKKTTDAVNAIAQNKNKEN